MVERRIKILDTTLRDGAQAPGCAFSLAQKVELAHLLDGFGVDIIEAGFPTSSRLDFEACRLIASEGLTSAIAVMTRAKPEEIKLSASVFSLSNNRESSILHLTLPVSRLHMARKLGKTQAETLRIAQESVSYASGFSSIVEMGAEDATRADRAFLAEYCGLVIEAGASIVNIADTVGICRPGDFFSLITFLMDSVPSFRDGRAVLSAHCHNDFGLATANTLAAIDAGCGQVEVTISGIGERAGNASLEELYANLRFAANSGEPAGVKSIAQILFSSPDRLIPLARRLASVLGTSDPPFKPVTGRNLHAHASGLHQDGVIRDSSMYAAEATPMNSREVERIVLGPYSGRSGFSAAVERFTGLILSTEDSSRLLTELKNSPTSIPSFGITELLSLLCLNSYLPTPPIRCMYIEENSTLTRFFLKAQIDFVDSGPSRSLSASGSTWSGTVLSLVAQLFSADIIVKNLSISAFNDVPTACALTVRLSLEAETTATQSRQYSIERVGTNQTKLLIDCLLDIINAENCLTRPS